MKRAHGYKVTLLIVGILWYWGWGASAYAALAKPCTALKAGGGSFLTTSTSSGGCGGTSPPSCLTNIQLINVTDDCGVVTTGTRTTKNQYYSGRGCLPIQVTEETHSLYPIGDAVDESLVTAYQRDTSGTLLLAQTTGNRTKTYFVPRPVTNYTVTRNYTIFPGEVPKVVHETIQMIPYLDGTRTTSLMETIDYNRDATTGILLAASGRINGSVIGISSTYDYSLMGSENFVVIGDEAKLSRRDILGVIRDIVNQSESSYSHSFSLTYDSSGKLIEMTGTGPIWITRKEIPDGGGLFITIKGNASPEFILIGCGTYISRNVVQEEIRDDRDRPGEIENCETVVEYYYDNVGRLITGSVHSTCSDRSEAMRLEFLDLQPGGWGGLLP